MLEEDVVLALLNIETWTQPGNDGREHDENSLLQSLEMFRNTATGVHVAVGRWSGTALATRGDAVIDLFGEVAGISFTPDSEALFVAVTDLRYRSLMEFHRRRPSLALE